MNILEELVYDYLKDYHGIDKDVIKLLDVRKNIPKDVTVVLDKDKMGWIGEDGLERLIDKIKNLWLPAGIQIDINFDYKKSVRKLKRLDKQYAKLNEKLIESLTNSYVFSATELICPICKKPLLAKHSFDGFPVSYYCPRCERGYSLACIEMLEKGSDKVKKKGGK